jgi:arylsulfatase A-like enzyme
MILRHLIRAVPLLTAILFAACARPPQFNVLLVTLDTTRADRLGCYGYTAAHTPVLDSLAADGVLFESAFTPAPVTLPAHASLLTGLVPPVHGVRDNGIYRLRDEAVTLAELLGDAGMATSATIAAYVLTSRFGLAQGFAHYDERLKGVTGKPAAFYVERSAGEVTDAAIQWLKQRNSNNPHSPYRD